MSEKMDRRGFFGILGTIGLGFAVPKRVAEVIESEPEMLQVIVNVRDNDHGRAGRNGLEGAYLAGRHWPYGRGPFRTYPIKPFYASEGTIPCLDCEILPEVAEKNYSDHTQEKHILRIYFEPQDLGNMSGFVCEGAEIGATASDHADIFLGWEAEEVTFSFKVVSA